MRRSSSKPFVFIGLNLTIELEIGEREFFKPSNRRGSDFKSHRIKKLPHLGFNGSEGIRVGEKGLFLADI